MTSKILTVWGSPSGGKTTLSVNLAMALAERNNTVGIISSNIAYGELQTLFGRRIEENRGILRAIANRDTRNCFEETQNQNVFFLSLPNNADGLVLTAVNGNDIRDVIEDSAIRFEYVIIDGSADLNNPISSIGLNLAQTVIISHRASVKDVMWNMAMQNVSELLHLENRSIHVLSGYDKTCDKAAFLEGIGTKMRYELAYIDNAKILENSGKLIWNSRIGTETYKKVMRRLAAEIMAGGVGYA